MMKMMGDKAAVLVFSPVKPTQPKTMLTSIFSILIMKNLSLMKKISTCYPLLARIELLILKMEQA